MMKTDFNNGDFEIIECRAIQKCYSFLLVKSHRLLLQVVPYICWNALFLQHWNGLRLWIKFVKFLQHCSPHMTKGVI